MPSLGKHDALATKYLQAEVEIERARALNELRVETSLGLLVFTPETRSRLEAVGAALTDIEDPEAIVEWVMDDKSVVEFKDGGPESLIREALILVGQKTQRAYQYAQEMKAKFREDPKSLTARDIAPEKWI